MLVNLQGDVSVQLVSRLYGCCPPTLPVLILHSMVVSKYVAANVSLKDSRRRLSFAFTPGLRGVV